MCDVTVRVPDGTYTAKATFNMGPYGGTVEGEKILTITNPSREVLDKLIEDLEAEAAGTRLHSANKLAEYGSDARKAASLLIRATHDTDIQVRRAACTTLGRIGVDTDEVVDALLTALKDDNATVRAAACQACGSMRDHADQVFSAVI